MSGSYALTPRRLGDEDDEATDFQDCDYDYCFRGFPFNVNGLFFLHSRI